MYGESGDSGDSDTMYFAVQEPSGENGGDS
jgi:hypothetical protein